MMVSVEEAESVVSDSQEALDMVDRISQALSLPISNSDTISKEVDNELARLIDDTKDSTENRFDERKMAAFESKVDVQIPATFVSSRPSRPERIAVPL